VEQKITISIKTKYIEKIFYIFLALEINKKPLLYLLDFFFVYFIS
jgi:hypothetical protein